MSIQWTSATQPASDLAVKYQEFQIRKVCSETPKPFKTYEVRVPHTLAVLAPGSLCDRYTLGHLEVTAVQHFKSVFTVTKNSKTSSKGDIRFEITVGKDETDRVKCTVRRGGYGSGLVKSWTVVAPENGKYMVSEAKTEIVDAVWALQEYEGDSSDQGNFTAVSIGYFLIEILERELREAIEAMDLDDMVEAAEDWVFV